jgi:hypothetical protein
MKGKRNGVELLRRSETNVLTQYINSLQWFDHGRRMDGTRTLIKIRELKFKGKAYGKTQKTMDQPSTAQHQEKKTKGLKRKEKENTVGRHNRLEIFHPLIQTNKKITSK